MTTPRSPADADAFLIDRRAKIDRRQKIGYGGRRMTDYSVAVSVLAEITGMSSRFLLEEIEAGELKAVQFGREWRVPTLAACAYLTQKGWPIPDWLHCALTAA